MDVLSTVFLILMMHNIQILSGHRNDCLAGRLTKYINFMLCSFPFNYGFLFFINMYLFLDISLSECGSQKMLREEENINYQLCHAFTAFFVEIHRI